MIHACGDVGLVHDLAFHPRLVSAARGALEARAVIFTDTRMLAAGITRRRLPAESEVRCLVDDPRASELAERWETTRSAAAVSLWGERLAGAVVAIGNAPTALFHLLELIADGAPRPAAIIGTPVGFVGRQSRRSHWQEILGDSFARGTRTPRRLRVVRGRRQPGGAGA